MTSTVDGILDEVLSERLRQINRHGYTAAHDDEHSEGQIARAALNYLGAAAILSSVDRDAYDPRCPPPFRDQSYFFQWPWDLVFWKPGTRRRILIKVMALCCAEVERIDRAEARRG